MVHQEVLSNNERQDDLFMSSISAIHSELELCQNCKRCFVTFRLIHFGCLKCVAYWGYPKYCYGKLRKKNDTVKLKSQQYWFISKWVFVISKAQKSKTMNCCVFEITHTILWHANVKFGQNSVPTLWYNLYLDICICFFSLEAISLRNFFIYTT